MARVCQVTGKRTRSGGSIARRGLAKAKGGVGIKTTGHSKRTFKPNVQKIRIVLPDGTVERIRVCTKVIKTGMIEMERGGKTMRFPLIKAVRNRA
jgi:large subunit ribosomal protein L28